MPQEYEDIPFANHEIALFVVCLIAVAVIFWP